MLTKPQFFYDHTTKQALGFQNPFYLKKAQQLEPKLYDGNVIKNTSAIVIPDSEETLMLAEESPFWSQNSMNSPEPTLSSRPTKVEVPKELPKVSMVNTSLKKLKHHLAGFDVVVKERTTPTAITEGSWGFKHTKAYFKDEIIPFCLKLEAGLLNIKDFIEKEIYDKLFKSFTTLEKHCISLEVDTQLNQEIFQRDNFVSNQSAPSFDQLFELNELKAQYQEKDTVIKKLKEIIKSLSGKMNEDKIKKELEEIETINIELDHRVSKLIAENKHLKQTYKQLYDSIKPTLIRSKEQCDDLINQVNLKSVEISDLNASLYKKVLEIISLKDDLRKLKGKALVDNVVTKHTIDQRYCVVQPKGTAHVQHSKLNANSELKCVKCNGCMLFDNHDLCVLDFINNVNARKQSKSVKKSSKRKVWKPTGKVFTNIGYIWRPTGQTFTIVGNACPLTRITTTTEVPLRKPTALEEMRALYPKVSDIQKKTKNEAKPDKTEHGFEKSMKN
ncbi:hypothetical protein Tco_1110119 [Tanacetum coccineum]|uniref:Uncharacterized protein n=1 Tax=Tanacetum coccineum TaxID=301880 RepID=A0ABQ5IJ32_9ASTR